LTETKERSRLENLEAQRSKAQEAVEEAREALSQLHYERRAAAFVAVGGGDAKAVKKAEVLDKRIAAQQRQLRNAELAAEIAAQDPSLTPQQAFIKASDTRDGQELVNLHHRLRRAEETAEKSTELRSGPHPAVAAINRRADQVRKDAALMGSPITEGEAFAKAMNESPEQVADYYAEQRS
jgi:hypothetical protein